jgi:hypothetical protein
MSTSKKFNPRSSSVNPLLKSQTVDRSRILEHEEAVKVVIRCRPMNMKEHDRGMPNIFQLTGSSGEVILHKPDGNIPNELDTLNMT